MKSPFVKALMFGLLLATAFTNGCASTEASKHKLSLNPDFGMPASGKSKVVFLRPNNLGYAIHFGVHDGTQLIGRSSSSEYFAYECEPGRHVFSTSMENLTFLDADLLPDRIYYVQVEAVMGWWIARVEMNALYPGCSEINWKEMPNILAGLEKTKITDYDVKNDKIKIRGYMERLKEYQDKPHSDKNRILPEYGQAAPLY